MDDERQGSSFEGEQQDPFSDLFNLEEQYYEQGYSEGHTDGLLQSRIEARMFGIEKGFEKFVEMGRLQARASLWSARLPASLPSSISSTQPSSSQSSTDALSHPSNTNLPRLKDNERLKRHIETLLALVDRQSLSLENSDDTVAEFDDRFKRAVAKVKILEKLTGETRDDLNGTSDELTDRVIPGKKEAASKKPASRADADMENFGLT